MLPRPLITALLLAALAGCQTTGGDRAAFVAGHEADPAYAGSDIGRKASSRADDRLDNPETQSVDGMTCQDIDTEILHLQAWFPKGERAIRTAIGGKTAAAGIGQVVPFVSMASAGMNQPWYAYRAAGRRWMVLAHEYSARGCSRDVEDAGS